MYYERKLFDLIHNIGPHLGDTVHICELDNNEPENLHEYIVYHGDGYCFVSSKEAEYDDGDESGNVTKYSYGFSQPYDGFTEIAIEKAIDIIKKL